ncbi:MAG: transcriptional repressor [Anaerolineae bacterium]|jgi:Fur family ferric uptake transcriptional regulator|nr:transcriptional repressor [Anaerolineae bacterium]
MTSDQPDRAHGASGQHDQTAHGTGDQDIARIFHEAGYRMTGQRLALLAVLRDQNRFLDAETIYTLVRQQGVKLSLATVYRTLALLKQMNLAEGRLVGEGRDREEYRFRSPREQYTLTCKRCGKIVPVEPDIVNAFREEVTGRLNVTVLTAHACFIGYCAGCTAALAAEENDSSAPPGVL